MSLNSPPRTLAGSRASSFGFQAFRSMMERSHAVDFLAAIDPGHSLFKGEPRLRLHRRRPGGVQPSRGEARSREHPCGEAWGTVTDVPESTRAPINGTPSAGRHARQVRISRRMDARSASVLNLRDPLVICSPRAPVSATMIGRPCSWARAATPDDQILIRAAQSQSRRRQSSDRRIRRRRTSR